MKQPTASDRSNGLSGSVPRSRYFIFLGLAAAGCLADLWTKWYVFRHFFDPEDRRPAEYWFIHGWLGIETSTNQGALFGMGQGASSLFAALSVVALIGIVLWLFVGRAAHDRLLTVALGCVTGGILGNLYDRLGLWHSSDVAPQDRNAVRDWIHFRWEGGPSLMNPWPNFNIADSLLVCGAAALLLHAAMMSRKDDTPSDQRLAAESADS